MNEKERLIAEISQLEEANHDLCERIKALRSRLKEKKQGSREVMTRAREMEKELVRINISEVSLLNEIRFFEDEREILLADYQNIEEALDASICALDQSIRDINFIKGETRALVEEMGALEKEFPQRNASIGQIDDTFSIAFKSMNELYDRMHQIEKDVKLSFYSRESDLMQKG